MHGIVSKQKIGAHTAITQGFIRSLRNFMNNWETHGCTFKFDGYRAVLRIDPQVGGAAPTPPHPWRVTRADDGEQKRIRVHPGLLDNLIPTNIFDTFNIPDEGLRYLVLTGSVDPNAKVTSCELSIENEPPEPMPPTPESPSSEVKTLIAAILDGRIFQIITQNINVSSQEVFQETLEDPPLVGRQYTPWYKWFIS